MQLKLPGIDNRKNLGAERAADHGNNCAADDEIGEHDEASSFHQHVCKPIVCGTQPIEKGLLWLLARAPAAQHPDRQYRHKGAGQQIRPHHRKADCQGQWHEKIVCAPVMKKAGMNTARMHSIATNRGNVVSAVASLAARARLRPSPSRVWLFSIVTVASSTRMPTASASPPRVMMLIV